MHNVVTYQRGVYSRTLWRSRVRFCKCAPGGRVLRPSSVRPLVPLRYVAVLLLHSPCSFILLAKLSQPYHGDVILREFKLTFPDTFDRDDPEAPPPSSRVLNYMSRLRDEPPSEEGSAEEGVLPKGSGSRGHGEPKSFGVEYISREVCDGQTLASPGRWPISSRRYPDSTLWPALSACFKFGTPDLLMRLALARVDSCPFDAASIRSLKSSTLDILSEHGLKLVRTPDDRTDVPIDYRYLQLLLDAAEVGLGDFGSGVRVGPGARLPRIPALYPRKKKWSLLKQMDPLDDLEQQSGGEAVWRQNFSSLEAYTDKVLEVMHDQANRGQVLRLSEEEAKKDVPQPYGRIVRIAAPLQPAHFSTEPTASLSTTGRG